MWGGRGIISIKTKKATNQKGDYEFMSFCKEHSLPAEHSGVQVCCLEHSSYMDDDLFDVSAALDMDLPLNQLDRENLISNKSRLRPEMLSPALRSPLGACSSRSAGSRRKKYSSSKIERALCPVE